MNWVLLNRGFAQSQYTHYVFFDPQRGRVAIADHSLRNLSDPGSTDDGLLLVAPTQTVIPLARKLCVPACCLDVITEDGSRRHITTHHLVGVMVECLLELWRE